VASFSHVSPPTPYTHCSPPSKELHATFISFFSILSPHNIWWRVKIMNLLIM
jgi:hypothetical protein